MQKGRQAPPSKLQANISNLYFLQTVMASNMMEYLESNNILYEMQHGFRSNRSCESQIISLAHQLAQNNDKNIQTDLIIKDSSPS